MNISFYREIHIKFEFLFDWIIYTKVTWPFPSFFFIPKNLLQHDIVSFYVPLDALCFENMMFYIFLYFQLYLLQNFDLEQLDTFNSVFPWSMIESSKKSSSSSPGHQSSKLLQEKVIIFILILIHVPYFIVNFMVTGKKF